MTVDELGRRITSAELSEWLAFDRLYGLPDVYWQTATLCATLEGLWCDKPRKPSDVVPFFGDDGAAGQSPAEMLERFKLIAAASKR